MNEYYPDKNAERMLIQKVRRAHRRYMPAIIMAGLAATLSLAFAIGVWFVADDNEARKQNLSAKATLVGAILATTGVTIAFSGGKDVLPAREDEMVYLKDDHLCQTFQITNPWSAEERNCTSIENVIDLSMASGITYNEKFCRLEIHAPYTQIRHMDDGSIETNRKEKRPFYLYAYYANWDELKAVILAKSVQNDS